MVPTAKLTRSMLYAGMYSFAALWYAGAQFAFVGEMVCSDPFMSEPPI